MRNPVIVVPCFNKTRALERLLSSLQRAYYPKDVKIVFSVDYSGNENVLRIAEQYHWPYGEKEIITHETNIGLRANILSCGQLSEKYGSVIILEDDSYVAKNFYDYALKAKEYYKADDVIAGISLYAYEYSEISTGRFCPVRKDIDVYFMQWASSRGQLWTANQWSLFISWYDNNKDADLSYFNIPERVVGWTRFSWKKFFIAYLVDTNRFFAYPYISFVTNCGDAGTHIGMNGDFILTQVSLQPEHQVSSMRFSQLSSGSIKYDAFFEVFPDLLKQNKKLQDYEFDVDLAGVKRIEDLNSNFILSSKKCKNPIVSFSNVLIPLETNIIEDCEGQYFSLGKVEDFYKEDSIYGRIYQHLVNREIPTTRICLDYFAVKVMSKLGLRGKY